MMGRRKKVPEKKPEEYIPRPPERSVFCPRCGKEVTEICFVIWDRYLHCTGCDHVFQAGEHTSKSKGVLCPYCREKVTAPSARVETGFGHSVADMHYCNGCGRLFHIRSYDYYPHWLEGIENDWKRNPVQYIGGTYRCKREKITVDYAIVGLCSDGRYLTEAYYTKMDGRILRRMLKMPMGEEGEPVFPRPSIRCPDGLWMETRRGYQKQEGIWCMSL
ncbi:MAG: hypothetical protein AB7E75_02280 [Candidatus Methanomethylophilaceae archaeon]